MRREGLEGANEPSESGNNGGGEAGGHLIRTKEGTILLSNGSSASYVTLSPENSNGLNVGLLPGIPMINTLMSPLAHHITKAGHRVTLLNHSTRGDPTLVRPEAICRLIKEGILTATNDEFPVLVCHSYASIDTARALEDEEVLNQVKSVVLLAPTGIRTNSLRRHLSSYQRYLHSGKSPDEQQFLRQWNQLSYKLASLPQLLRAVRDITKANIVNALLDIQNDGVDIHILEPFNDTLLSGESLLEPPYTDNSDEAVNILNRRRVKVEGDHNCPLIQPDIYAKPLMDILKRLSS